MPLDELWTRAVHHLNFFRVHLLIFTFTPIVFACILYAANGSATGNANSSNTGMQKVTFVDSLFLCFSSMTVTGLVTVNVSALHPFQQVLLFILFLLGDYSVVSLIMVLVRKHYFRTHCEQLLLNDRLRRTKSVAPPDRTFDGFTDNGPNPSRKVSRMIRSGNNLSISAPVEARAIGDFVEDRREGTLSNSPLDMTFNDRERTATAIQGEVIRDTQPIAPHLVMNGLASRAESPQATTTAVATPIVAPHLGETSYSMRQRLRSQTRAGTTINLGSLDRPLPLSESRISGPPLLHAPTAPRPDNHHMPKRSGHKNTGYGGFPTPLEMLHKIVPPSTKRRLAQPIRRLELARNQTYIDKDEEEGLISHDGVWGEHIRDSIAKWMPEGLAGLVIGRNSRFWTEELDDDELEQIGGVEYRALRLLSHLVAGYIFLYQAIPFAVIAIYFAKVQDWDSAFQAKSGTQAGTVNKTWFSLFVSVSAYTGSGVILVDQGLAPFQTCYLLIYALIVVMLAGNHALPIMLRFTIWTGTKIFRRGEIHETLHFLLDHPRRCFLYLFPSHQTWYLVFILLAFMLVELFSFLVLNIGLPVLDSLGGWQRFSDGLLQSLSVRAAGFGIVAVSNMAPSILFLYVILMYVAIYPIAMSVRSTNVYEEQAIGVYNRSDPDMSSEDEPDFKGKKHEVFSKYLMWHMRRQLAFDIWPLATAIFLISVFERGKILDPDKSTWFTIFRILFECTSAYSTIGLTLGTPNNNYSFSGEFGTVSKLIMILVMLRGRHRGLPVAIDRAILLPKEYSRIGKPAQVVNRPKTSTLVHASTEP